MIANETELKAEVREMTGYKTANILSDDGLDTAYTAAQRHIRVQKNLDPSFSWFGSEKAQATDALFWYTCLFAKVQTGELDSQDLQVGAVNSSALLAKDNHDVTTWYRNAKDAVRALKADSIIRASAPARTDRAYEADSYDEGTGGSGGTEVDSTDL